MKKAYEQKYRAEWEQNPEFSSWLSQDKNNVKNAFCKACNVSILSRLASIKEHKNTNKHMKNLINHRGQSKIDKIFKSSPLSQQIKKAELMICAALAEHNIPFNVMDHMSAVLQNAFFDSEIAKGFSCKRTKSSELVYDVMAPAFREDLHVDLLDSTCFGKNIYSLIIDESTDVSCTKTLAVAIMYYSKKACGIKTQFLDLVEMKGETAQDIFDALCDSLRQANLDIKQVLGFAADTTNVIFGQNAGVVAKIKLENPDCIFIKCVCHSIALAVSYASKVLPRTIDQVVKDVYNFFGHSSKRTREFIEFQEFVQSEKHMILRHYEIRWLSLHKCVNRIIEQWSALLLFFQHHALEERNTSVDFLLTSLNDKIIKLYFIFLDYILPIVNKFNIIFQGNYCVIHRLHKEVTDMYKSILGCYLKNDYVKNTPIHMIDLESTRNFLPLNELYLGVNVGKEILSIKDDPTMKTKLKEFFTRCQSFYIELCKQINNRLPFDAFFHDVKFLDPQIAALESFTSLLPILNKFPKIVDESQHQVIDEEFRQMKFDTEVSNLLTSSSQNSDVVSMEAFWEKVHNLKRNSQAQLKYDNICQFAKALMCLPVSNTACERIFSQVNLTKTKTRNRFLNRSVAAILHTKQGVKNVGGCISFHPDDTMLKKFYKTSRKETKNDDSEVSD